MKSRFTKFALICCVTALVSACVVRPVHRPVAVGVKTVAVLEKEHNSNSVVIVTNKPAAGRVCWRHKNHWHCKR